MSGWPMGLRFKLRGDFRDNLLLAFTDWTFSAPHMDIVSISQSDTELQALWQFEIKLLWINFGLESNQERKSSSLLIGFCS
jgi:hypothetical protein